MVRTSIFTGWFTFSVCLFARWTIKYLCDDSHGGTPTQLTRGAGNNTEPSWSPDGSSILFTSDRGGSPQVYRMSANGGSATPCWWSW